jgi:cyanophycinase
MVLCEHYYDPAEKKLMRGLNLFPNACVLPHHNTFGRSWAAQLAKAIPGATLIGIDEQTGMLNDQKGGWQVYGAGQVTLYDGKRTHNYGRGETFSF